MTLEQFERFPAYTNWVDAHPARIWGVHAPDCCWPSAQRDRIRTHAQLVALEGAYPDGLELLRVNLTPKRFSATLEHRTLFTRVGTEVRRLHRCAAVPLIWTLHGSKRYGPHLHLVAPAGARIKAGHREGLYSGGDDLSTLAQYFCDPMNPVFKAEMSLDLSTGQLERTAPPAIGSPHWLEAVERVCTGMASDALKHPHSRLPSRRGTVGFSRALQAAVKVAARDLEQRVYVPSL